MVADHCLPETWGSEIEAGVQSRLHTLGGYRSVVQYVKKAQNYSVDSYSAFGDVSGGFFVVSFKEWVG